MKRKVRRRRQPARVYRARRMGLLLVLIAVIGVGAWKVYGIFHPAESKEPPSTQAVINPADGVSNTSSSSKIKDADPESQSPSSQTSKESTAASKSPTEDAPSVDRQNWALLLVNDTNPIPEGYIDTIDLVAVTDGYQVDARIADNIRRMFTDAKKDGISLVICSAFRSPEKQEENFNWQIQQYMANGDSEEQAYQKTIAYYAKPGYSEHHTGLAVDIVTPDYRTLDAGYAATPAANWLLKHAYEYGFILRYPKNKEDITKINFEPWHYRYVGIEHAQAIKNTGECLEEYVHAAQTKQTQGTKEDPSNTSVDQES